MHIKKVMMLVLFICCLTAETAICAFAADLLDQRNVLILSSYNKGHRWTDSIVSGIESVFSNSAIQANLYYEYMDAKRCFDDTYFEYLYQLYEYKYRQTRFDAVIVSDDDALNFIKNYRKKLFYDAPVIFCGINQGMDKVQAGRENMTGILERPDFRNSVDIALKLHPEAERIIAICDQTNTGQLLKEDFDRATAYLKADKEVIMLSDNWLENVRSSLMRLSQSSEKSIVFCLGMNFKDGTGDVVTTKDSLKLLKNDVDMPFYSAWDFLLGDGIVGGALVSGFIQGKTVAEIAQRVLQGAEIDSIPITAGSTNINMFDYAVLKQHNIERASLPQNSRLINLPSEYYTIQKKAVWGTAAFVILLLMFINIALLSNIFVRKKAELELAESEALLRALINGTPDVICFRDAEGRWLEANEAILQLFGLDSEAYKGKNIEEIAAESALYEKTHKKCRETEEKTWKKGSIYQEELELVLPDESKRIYDVIKAPLFHSNGERRGLVLLGRDTTAHKTVEEALCKKEEILRATFNATMDGILVVNNERKVIDYNRKFVELWNIPEELMEKRDDRTLLDYVKNEVIESEKLISRINSLYDIPAKDIYHATFTDGRVYEIHTAPLVAPEVENGMMMGRVWSFRDITLRVTAEKALCESEERYRKLIDVLPDAVFVSVRECIVYLNAAAVKLLRAEAAGQIIGRPVLGFIHEDDREVMEHKIKEAIRGRRVMPLAEHKLIRADSSQLDVEIVVTVFYYKGELALMTVIRDITERKRANELRKKMEENMKLLNEALEYDKLKTEFFANISHELRTPLNIILGTLQLFNMLLSGQEGNAHRNKMLRYTGIMKQNCYRLLRLLNNLIDITRIDSGFFMVHMENRDIVTIVEEITLSVAEYVENKGIRLIFDTDLEEKRIACDPDKIERIMLNLLSNAVKFTNEGGSITVRLQEEGDMIAISVRDTGIGIPDDKLSMVFERFRQVDKSFTRNCEGSGIGLSLVKSLVELHGGKTEVTSEVGVGSEFLIKLPDRLVSEAEENSAAGTAVQSRIERINIEFADIYI